MSEAIVNKCRALGMILQALGNVEDHVHIVVSIPPKLSVAAYVQHFKGSSSRAMNRARPAEFKWHGGYGAISLGECSLPAVINYVRNQKSIMPAARRLRFTNKSWMRTTAHKQGRISAASKPLSRANPLTPLSFRLALASFPFFSRGVSTPGGAAGTCWTVFRIEISELTKWY